MLAGTEKRSVEGRVHSSTAAALALLLAVGSALPIGWLEARPRHASEVAAVFAPWSTPESVIRRVAAADGRIVRQGTLSGIVVVHGDGRGLAARLYAAGAWAVLDPVAFGGCLIATNEHADASL